MGKHEESYLRFKEDFIDDLDDILEDVMSHKQRCKMLRQMESLGDYNYPAVVTVLSVIFYQHWNLDIPSLRKEFTGDSGGIFGSSDVSVGNLETDDIQKLFNETQSFMFSSAADYLGLIFFDRNSNPLGSYLGASLPILGIGGGTGNWHN